MEKNSIENGLYVVSTPIGNLADISFRAVKVLKEVDFIACEDTRNTGKILQLLEIGKKQLIQYHDYNEAQQALFIINQIKDGRSAALVSDAGTPLISDPGYKLIRSATEHGIKIIPIPGCSSILAALAASGMTNDSFTFLGFPPQKKGRQTFLKNLNNYEHTVILFESPFRVVRLVEEMLTLLGPDRRVCIARELTKLHEEFIRGTLSECLDILKSSKNVKGEFVVLLDKKLV